MVYALASVANIRSYPLNNPFMRPYQIPLFLFLALSCHFVSHAQFKVYGVTAGSGPGNAGVLFSVLTDGTNFQLLHGFTGGSDGANPSTAVTMGSGAKLYGVTSAGGANSVGTIFAYDTVTQIYQKVADLSNDIGIGIGGPLTFFNNKFYGLAANGGAAGTGSIISYDPSTGILSKEYDFNVSTGANPSGSATVYNNKLYFSTTVGGANNSGTIMAFDPDGRTCYDVYDLYVGGATLNAVLALENNVFYSTSLYGGGAGDGNLYSIDPRTRIYRDYFDFSLSGYDFGRNPLTLAPYNGLLYGTTYRGGTNDIGTIFSLNPSTDALSQLFAWGPADIVGTDQGYIPTGNLVITPNGLLLGETTNGGTANVGVIYTCDLNFNVFSKVFDFNITNGSTPVGGLYLPPLPVGATPQTITFNDISAHYGDADFDPGAVASSNLPIMYFSSDSTIATIVHEKIHIVRVGTCQIKATQIGDSTYAMAPPVTRTLTITF
jgi:uncharacterized repeat protein (TIGR03803 family)